jgi:hypothetical protein
MRPTRDFRFQGKKEIFACVGFRYDQPQSIEYSQFKHAESVAEMVKRLLKMENGADIISIRRVYLLQEEFEPKTNDPEAKVTLDTTETRE